MGDVTGTGGAGYGSGNPPPEGYTTHGVPKSLLVPFARERTLFTQDADAHSLVINQVYIPYFLTAGFPTSDNSLNGVLAGGFWIDKYQACRWDATKMSGGTGTGGASCRDHVVVWTNVNWVDAQDACTEREGDDNHTWGLLTAYSSGNTSQFYIDYATNFCGQKIIIGLVGYDNSDTRYYSRRIVVKGNNNPSDGNKAKYFEVYPPIPSYTAGAYQHISYHIYGHHLMDAYEWFSMGALALKYQWLLNGKYNGGNTDYGKDVGDTRSLRVEGISDSTYNGGGAYTIYKTLAGSGPDAWYIADNQGAGVMDLVGNVWEWVDQCVYWGASGWEILRGSSSMCREDWYHYHGFPGEGYVVSGVSGGGGLGYIQAMYETTPTAAGLSEASYMCVPSTVGTNGVDEYNNDYEWGAALGSGYYHPCARGGCYSTGGQAGPWTLSWAWVPSSTDPTLGFRGCY